MMLASAHVESSQYETIAGIRHADSVRNEAVQASLCARSGNIPRTGRAPPSYDGTLQLTGSCRNQVWVACRVTQGFGVVYQWLPHGYESDGWKARMVNTIGESLPLPCDRL